MPCLFLAGVCQRSVNRSENVSSKLRVFQNGTHIRHLLGNVTLWRPASWHAKCKFLDLIELTVNLRGTVAMSMMNTFTPRAGASIVIPIHFIRFFYAMTAAVVIMGIGREIFMAFGSADTVLRDLRHFQLDAERNIGAWYSSALMVLISACAFFNWQTVKHRTEFSSYSWLLISVVFFLMSIDETAGFHETVDVPLRDHFELTGLFYNPWVFFGAFFVALFATALIPFLLTLPRHIAILFVISGAIYVGGALGLEPLDAFFENTQGAGSLLQIISTTVEETLEMLGLTLFLHANMLFMADSRTNLLLRR